MAYSPKCPFMVMLFVALAWLEHAAAFLGANFISRLHSPTVPKPFGNEVEEHSTSMDATLLTRPIPSTSLRPRRTVSGPVAADSPPWDASLSPSRELSYMPMFAHQLEVIEKMNLRPMDVDPRMSFQSSAVKPARISSLCFEGERFRKVRMTYFDAGDNVQVFNTVWYPRFEYDLPILGVDLISLGKSRVLSVVDFQPLHPTVEYAEKYIDQLAAVRRRFPALHGQLSGKIYTDTSFFSRQMLFGRFADESQLQGVVLPAFQEYLAAYVGLMAGATPDYRPEAMRVVQDRQQAYDTYSALKDPAVGLFDAYFGKEWSCDFVHNFLFAMAQPAGVPPRHSVSVDLTTGSVSCGAATRS